MTASEKHVHCKWPRSLVTQFNFLTLLCCRLVPILLACGKQSGTLTHQMVTASFSQLVNCINRETDASFLASLYKCFSDSLRVIEGPSSLPPEVQSGIIDASKRQLQSIADRRRSRASRPATELADDREDLMLMEEMEDYALEDMAKMLTQLNSNHELLVAVSGVRDLGLHLEQWESGDEGDSAG